jgi:hypothetical protein
MMARGAVWGVLRRERRCEGLVLSCVGRARHLRPQRPRLGCITGAPMGTARGGMGGLAAERERRCSLCGDGRTRTSFAVCVSTIVRCAGRGRCRRLGVAELLQAKVRGDGEGGEGECVCRVVVVNVRGEVKNGPRDDTFPLRCARLPASVRQAAQRPVRSGSRARTTASRAPSRAAGSRARANFALPSFPPRPLRSLSLLSLPRPF